MWTAQTSHPDQQTSRTSFLEGSRCLSYREVIELWRENESFRSAFAAAIRESAFDAFFWETPPVTDRTLDQPFEFVLIESQSLSRVQADASAFAEHFRARPSEEVLTFPNLGGDAVLVVPAPVAAASSYPHLARFLRTAPESQVSAFWEAAGNAMRRRVASSPVWLSTAGLGVSWLHLRLDSRPKYYRHAPYKTKTAA